MNCAIYTRVSTDNQVEKEYNSLETQKESLLAYVQAHKYEGWKVVDFYEEAGESASTLNRPELQRLIYDIRNKRVDAVIVYKIDRLTRNQKDFYSLIELFEKYNVTFIATTQNFDTSSAAGRLMRNIMLDFAQFEREMTAERTKDKMEARAKKGFWNGGLVPLGYDYSPDTKRLKINPAEAEIINLIFNTYLNEKSRDEKDREINRLIKAIKSGSIEIESIERELRLLEKDKKSLEARIENLDIFIQHQFLQLLIKDMNVYSDRVKVSFYEVPEMALNIEGPQKHDGLCEPSKWLRTLNEIRTFFSENPNAEF